MISYRRGILYLEKIKAETLARRYGSPLYVYSRCALVERFRRLRSAFDRDVLICYALKANSNRALCRILVAEGAGADIVSGGELRRALAAGFDPAEIVFSGVGKSDGEMALALRRRILALNVESAEELFALERVAARLRLKAPVSVRLNPDVDPRTHPHITTGRAENKFGVERREALAMYRYASKSRWLKPVGVQCHIGSQVTQAAPYRLAARSVARLVEDLSREKIPLLLADLGGGLGVAYRENDRDIELSDFARALTASFRKFPRLRLLLEPGRYLAAEAGVLLTTVLYRKKTSERRFLIVDAAMNDLARPALYGAYHPIRPARWRAGRACAVDVVGPVCESGDFLARRRSLPPCRPGDVLAVLKSGAYGFAMSSQYNSRPRPAEVLVDGNQSRLIRRREKYEDLVRHEL